MLLLELDLHITVSDSSGSLPNDNPGSTPPHNIDIDYLHVRIDKASLEVK